MKNRKFSKEVLGKLRNEFDTPWKELLVLHFEACLLFFFPRVHELVDWSRKYQFKDKESQKITRAARTGRRYADILVLVWLKSGKRVQLLIHVEVQVRKEERFPERNFIYYYRIFDRYRVDVISLAIFTDSNPAWRPDCFTLSHGGFELSMRYPVCKLIDFRSQVKWAELERHPNPFAKVIMAILTTMDTIGDPANRKRWKYEFTRQLYFMGLAQEYLDSLLHILDWFMVLPDNVEKQLEEEVDELKKEVKKVKFVSMLERIGLRKGLARGMEKGIKKGRVEGLREGRKEGRKEGFDEGARRARASSREIVLEVMRNRFGSVPVKVQKAIGRIDDDAKLKSLASWAMKANSLKSMPIE